MEDGHGNPNDLTWNQLWNSGCTLYNKSVCDIGRFNAYFCSKAKEVGAKEAVGYDSNFWEPGSFSRSFDVIMSVDVLHHVRQRLGEEKYLQAINYLFASCKWECLFVVSPKDREILIREGAKHDFIVANDPLNRRNGGRVLFMPKWGSTSKIKMGTICSYVGRRMSMPPNKDIGNVMVGKLYEFAGKVEEHFPHKRWADIRGNIDKMAAALKQDPLTNQPMHMLALQTYDYLAEISPNHRVFGGLRLIRDPIRILDCYNANQIGIQLPPIGIKENNALHQGHFRCRTYRWCGWGDDEEIDYLSKIEFMRRFPRR